MTNGLTGCVFVTIATSWLQKVRQFFLPYGFTEVARVAAGRLTVELLLGSGPRAVQDSFLNRFAVNHNKHKRRLAPC